MSAATASNGELKRDRSPGADAAANGNGNEGVKKAKIDDET